ncbi:UNVERIFIED_CONTAM: hypothetical protein Scaly_2994900 [Sesamum calycinum]|uniref:Retrotransposon gag domain-containing protein n=1 Tax=Sesamum calycinum TaxID=2727403 RepID=A0AAW2KED6_9LAMI
MEWGNGASPPSTPRRLVAPCRRPKSGLLPSPSCALGGRGDPLALASFAQCICIQLFNEIHISNPCAIYCFATTPCLNLLLLLFVLLSCRRAVLVSADIRLLCCYRAEVVVYCGLLATRCPFPALRKAPREKWYQSLGATMGPRRVAVNPANSAARMPGQDAESPRHAASPSERAANPEDENSRLTELVMNLEEKVSSLETEITVLNSELEECRQVVQEMASAFGGGGIADMSVRWSRCRSRLVCSNVRGARDAKEVENFLFDMEQYFLAANVEDEARKVSTATMYLTGDAKLWWRTKYAEIQPTRRALRKLEHTGSVRDYVKTFSALMLDIRDMSEKDKLFTFMEGLKPWARLELQRQRVTDLGSAMAAAERLTDFNRRTGRIGRQRLAPRRISRAGRDRSGVTPTEVGETASPTLRIVHRAVLAGTSPRRTSRGRRRRAVDASYATARIDIGLPEETVVERAGDLH